MKNALRINSRHWFTLCLSLLVAGCFDQSSEPKGFRGDYYNQFSADRLIFDGQTVEILSDGLSMKVPFTEDEDQLIIEYSRSSREKRPDMMMRVHGNGELLTCSACPMYDLSNVWIKINAQPVNQPQ